MEEMKTLLKRENQVLILSPERRRFGVFIFFFFFFCAKPGMALAHLPQWIIPLFSLEKRSLSSFGHLVT
jgi:hypothetical protein